MLVHGPGDVQGQRVELDDEQVRFVLAAYALDDFGRRLIRRAVFSRPKGRAKSELAALLVCAEALGPVRFRGWDHDGRPLGGPVQAAYIPCVATEETQAGTVYGAAEFMLREGAGSATPGLDIAQTRVSFPTAARWSLSRRRRRRRRADGRRLAVFDETHLVVTPELGRSHETIRRN